MMHSDFRQFGEFGAAEVAKALAKFNVTANVPFPIAQWLVNLS